MYINTSEAIYSFCYQFRNYIRNTLLFQSKDVHVRVLKKSDFNVIGHKSVISVKVLSISDHGVVSYDQDIKDKTLLPG